MNPNFAEAVKALKELGIKSDLPELEKEEILAEIERSKQLAQKEQTDKVFLPACSLLINIRNISNIQKLCFV